MKGKGAERSKEERRGDVWGGRKGEVVRSALGRKEGGGGGKERE